MSRPSILTSLTAATDIAGEAIFSLGAARKNFAEFEALFRAIGSAAEEHSDLAKLARLGEFSAMDHGNGYDCLREEYELRLEKCTPQNTQPENVARIPLAEFAKRRQHAAALELGVQQAAISKALRVGREIFVTRNPDGTVTAIEVRPFPCVTVEGGVK